MILIFNFEKNIRGRVLSDAESNFGCPHFNFDSVVGGVAVCLETTLNLVVEAFIPLCKSNAFVALECLYLMSVAGCFIETRFHRHANG